MNVSFRNAQPHELAGALQDARDYTLALFDCFAAAELDRVHNVPMLGIVNPPLWELGHIAWFAEWYILREAESSAPDAAKRPCLLTKGDDWFDSNTVPHRARWALDLPASGALKTYCREVLSYFIITIAAFAATTQMTIFSYAIARLFNQPYDEPFLLAI
ncbi:MAG: DinB family protein, partial [Burkholderiaceae bacterium]